MDDTAENMIHFLEDKKDIFNDRIQNYALIMIL